MRAWQIQDRFGVEHLALVERPDPGAPGPGQLRVRPRAVSLNYRDLMMIRGHYNPRQPLPLVPCSDAVAVVEAVGEGVTGFAPGDRVCPAFHQTWLSGVPTRAHRAGTLGGPLDGVLQEVLHVRAAAAVHAPEALSDAEASTLPCAGVTAWRALVTEGGLAPGDTVLTLGTGGVSLYALAIAKALGARVAITSSSDAKLERARALGADLCVNYATTPAWGKAVAAWTGGQGVDLVVELGGAGTVDQSLRAVRVGGTVALIGVLAGVRTELDLTKVFMSAVRVQGIFVGDTEDLTALARAMAANPALRPVVDRVFDFEAFPEALGHLAAGGHLGKVVVEVG
ncbi:MAG: NAD(P)-dependent alcohol dehydrogenase [Alphaproteobacteria bacterium]|nr:NAD(P)-dependent alcohol dehydrogenase [Alphaproteobacteria bacterium]